jgi:hypothetical protein
MRMLASEQSEPTPKLPPVNRGGRPRGSGARNLEKAELERMIAAWLKSPKTPVQYRAGLASIVSSLKGWSKNATDETIRSSIGDMLRSWGRERVYSGASKSSDALRAEAHMGDGAGAYASGDGGDPPTGAATEAVDPLTTANSHKNPQQVEVNATLSDVQDSAEATDGARLPGKHDSD